MILFLPSYRVQFVDELQIHTLAMEEKPKFDANDNNSFFQFWEKR